MTAAVATSAEARARVDRIKTGVEVIWSLIVESYQARDWDALGYSSWDDMCTREFGTSRLRLPREERAETVHSLRDAGLSLRAISSATGHDVKTVRNDLAQVREIPTPDVTVEESDETVEEIDARLGPIGYEIDRGTGEILRDESLAGPEPLTPSEHHPTVTGIDGKTYHRPTVQRKPPRKPLSDVAKTRGFALREATDAVQRLFDDDRYRTNEKQVADALRGHLLYVAETVAAVLDQLP